MTFGVLFLIVIAGLFGPWLSGFRRFAVPLVVGEIAAGVLFGNTGLHWINAVDPNIQFLSNVGVAMLMFLVGTKLPLRDQGLRKALRHSGTATALAVGFAIPLAFLLERLTGIHESGVFILLLACSSTNVVMPMISEHKLSGPVVMMTTMWVLTADVSTLVLLPMTLTPGRLLATIFGAALVSATAIGCFVGMRFWRQSQAGIRYRALSKERGWALDLRMSLAVLFGLSWLAAWLGTSSLVAGFAAGAIVTLLEQPRRFTKQLIGLAEGFFVPLFFVALGARLDFHALFASWLNLELVGLIVVGSLIVHLIVAKTTGLPWASGLVATSQLGLPATIVALGLSENFLTPGQGAAIMAAAMVLLFLCSMGVQRLARFSQPGYVPSRNPNSEETADPENASGTGISPDVDDDEGTPSAPGQSSPTTDQESHPTADPQPDPQADPEADHQVDHQAGQAIGQPACHDVDTTTTTADKDHPPSQPK